MRLHWADLGATLAMVTAGCAATGWLLLRKLGNEAAERQLLLERELIALDDALRAVEMRLAHMQISAGAAASVAREPEDAFEQGGEQDGGQLGESVAPEIKAAIAAAAIAAVGPRAHVRAVRPVRSLEPEVSAWTQQGRVSVQSSHNMRPGRQAPARSTPERES